MNYLPGIEPPANHPQMLEQIQIVRTRGNVHEVVGSVSSYVVCRCGMKYRSEAQEGSRGSVTCAKCLGQPKPIPQYTCTPWKPGTGPAGETCKTCTKALRVSAGNKRVWKCMAASEGWSHSVNSDIKLRWPACFGWTPNNCPPGAKKIQESYEPGGGHIGPMTDELEENGFTAIAWWLRKAAGMLTIEGATR